MSEEIILGGAYFDNNMPKWATEETIKRIANDLRKDNTESRKQNDKMLKLLGKIAQTATKGEKDQKDILKEIRTISKEIKDSNKTNEALVKEVKKSNKLAEDTNKAAKKPVSGNASSSSVNDVDLTETENHLSDVNRRLRDIYALMNNMSGNITSSIEERNKITGRSNVNTVITSSQNVSRQSDAATDNSITAFLNQMNDERDSRRTRRGLGAMNEITESKHVGKRFTGRVRKMIEAIGLFVGKIKKFGAAILGVIKKIPFVGTKIAAAITAMGAAFDLATMISESYQEYKDMLDRGISFARASVENTRMDGIMVRKMIAEAGLTFEAGVDAMKDNIAIVNEMGFEGYMQTISDVMENAQQSGAFVNRVMMSQNDIAEFSKEYLKSLKRMGDYERLNSEERVKGIRTFVKHSRMFAEMTGQSIEKIKSLMEDISKDPNISLFLSDIEDTDQRKQTESTIQLVKAVFGQGSPLEKAIIGGMTDVTGAGIAASDTYKELATLMGHIPEGNALMAEMVNLTRNADEMSVQQSSDLIYSIIEKFQDAQGKMTDETLTNLRALSQRDDRMGQLISSFLAANERLPSDREQYEEMLKRGGFVNEKSTEEAMLAQQARVTKQQAEASLEYMIANVADSDASRAAMEMGYKAMIEANDMVEKGALGAVATAHTIKNNLPAIARGVEDLVRLAGGDKKTREERAEEALSSRDLGSNAKAVRQALFGELTKSGLTTGNVEGVTRGRGRVSTQSFAENRKRFAEYGMSAEELLKESYSKDGNVSRVAKDMLMYLSSEQMKGVLSSSVRSDYRDALDKALSDMSDDQREQFYADTEKKLRSGSAAMLVQGRFQHERDSRKNGKKEPTSDTGGTESKSGNTVEEVRREAEEREARQEQEREQRARQNKNVTLNDQGIPNTIANDNVTRLDNESSDVNVINVLLDHTDRTNTLLDRLISEMKNGNDGTVGKLTEVKDALNRNRGSVSS